MGGTQRRTHVGTTCKVEETTPGSPVKAREGVRAEARANQAAAHTEEEGMEVD